MSADLASRLRKHYEIETDAGTLPSELGDDLRAAADALDEAAKDTSRWYSPETMAAVVKERDDTAVCLRAAEQAHENAQALNAALRQSLHEVTEERDAALEREERFDAERETLTARLMSAIWLIPGDVTCGDLRRAADEYRERLNRAEAELRSSRLVNAEVALMVGELQDKLDAAEAERDDCADYIANGSDEMFDATMARALKAEAIANAARATLQTIAANTCCEGCQEAAKVARASLEVL